MTVIWPPLKLTVFMSVYVATSFVGFAHSAMLDHALAVGSMSVCLSVTCSFCHHVVQELWFTETNFHTLDFRGTPLIRASNETGVAKNGKNP